MIGKNKHRKAIKTPKLKAIAPQVIELWVRAGGRCEFHGCNDYLLQDKLTTMKAKLADIAHIVARSENGPRGNDPLPLEKRNNFENIFLACTKHHRVIDNKAWVKKYPKELLVQYKQTHEERIKLVTGLENQHETMVVRMLGKIRGNTVSVSNEEIREAVLNSLGRYPRYMGGEHYIEIDLTSLSEKNKDDYWSKGIDKIKDVVDRLITPAIEKKEARHLSIFAFSRIPFLAYLGHVIGDKIPLEIFQKHRDGSEDWIWSKDGLEQTFAFKKQRNGSDETNVAVLLSLSGQISFEQLPSTISGDFTIYLLAPEGCTPNRNLLFSKKSMEQFRHTYASLLRNIEANHPDAKAIHVFPAIPVSAAIVLGRESLSNITPSLIIYDIGTHKFEQAIKIDSNRRG